MAYRIREPLWVPLPITERPFGSAQFILAVLLLLNDPRFGTLLQRKKWLQRQLQRAGHDSVCRWRDSEERRDDGVGQLVVLAAADAVDEQVGDVQPQVHRQRKC